MPNFPIVCMVNHVSHLHAVLAEKNPDILLLLATAFLELTLYVSGLLAPGSFLNSKYAKLAEEFLSFSYKYSLLLAHFLIV